MPWFLTPILILTLSRFLKEEGVTGIWHFLVLLVVCLVQAVYPTLVGWGVSFSFFAAYALVTAISFSSNPDCEHLVFLVLVAAPAVLLYVWRPRRAAPNVNESVPR